MSRFPHTEYFLCTDSDLYRFANILRRESNELTRKELRKVEAEIARREKLGRNSLIREFRKKIK